jgi:hypothetical protein
MRLSFVLVAGPRRHLIQSGSIGIEPTYGNEDQAEVGHGSAAHAAQPDPPPAEGFAIEIEVDVVDYIFPIRFVICARPGEFDGLGPETRAACASHGRSSHMSPSVVRIQPRGHLRQADIAPRLSARIPTHDPHLSASELLRTILTKCYQRRATYPALRAYMRWESYGTPVNGRKGLAYAQCDRCRMPPYGGIGDGIDTGGRRPGRGSPSDAGHGLCRHHGRDDNRDHRHNAVAGLARDDAQCPGVGDARQRHRLAGRNRQGLRRFGRLPGTGSASWWFRAGRHHQCKDVLLDGRAGQAIRAGEQG